MRKLFFIFLITGLSSTLFIAPTNAAVKAGSICAKLGVTSTASGKKFTCVKSGKKLIWSKGVPLAQPTPIIAPAQRAYNSIVDYYNKAPKATYEITKITHPKVTQQTVEKILARYESAIPFWRDSFAIKKVYIIIGNNDEIMWVKNQLEVATPYKYDDWYLNFSSKMPAQRCNTYSAGSYGINPNGFFMQSFNLYPADCQTEEPQDANYRTTVEHELVHAAQSAVTGNRVELFPCWFKEGQASYYGSALGNLTSFSNFKTSLDYQRRFLKGIEPKSQLKKLDEKYNNFQCGQDGGYSLGSLAVEQLVIKHSHSKILEFMSDVNRTSNWRTSFQSIFGESFEQFVENLTSQDLRTF